MTGESFISRLRDTTERPANPPLYDETWCPVNDGADLQRILIRRDKSFDGLVMQSVRLLRLMAVCDAGGYEGFLYLNPALPALRAKYFKQSFQRSLAAGDLDGIAQATPSGLRLLEPGMAARNGEPFDLGYAQMPKLAALLDVLYMCLTRSRLNEICGALYARDSRADAQGIGTELKHALLQWLKPLLEKDHRSRQYEVIRKYLEHRRASEPHDIDDALILNFWVDMAHSSVSSSAAPPEAAGEARTVIDGFVRYRNAASKLLDYRQAIMEARVKNQLEHAGDFSLSLSADDAGALDLDRTAFEPIETSEWVSPLHTLYSPPCAGIKWLKSEEDRKKLLAPLIYDPLLAGEDTPEKEAPVAFSLFPNEAPNARFFHSVLRFILFGSTQEYLIKGSANRDYQDYADIADRIAQIADHLEKTIAHVGAMLLDQKHEGGVLATTYLWPQMREALPDLNEQQWADLQAGYELHRDHIEAFADAIRQSGGRVAPLLGKTNAIKRSGLSLNDVRDKGADTYYHGLSALIAIHGYLQTYLSWLRAQDLDTLMRQDKAAFDAKFLAMYGIH